MVDKFVVAKVTISVAVNKSGAGTAFAYSNASNRIRKAAVFTGTPAISGSLHIGDLDIWKGQKLENTIILAP